MSVFNHKSYVLLPMLALLSVAPQELLKKPVHRGLASVMDKSMKQSPVPAAKPEAKVEEKKLEPKLFPKLEAKLKAVDKKAIVKEFDLKPEKVEADVTKFEASVTEQKKIGKVEDSLIINLAQLQSDLEALPSSEKDKIANLQKKIEDQKGIIEGLLPEEKAAIVVKKDEANKEESKKEEAKKEDPKKDEKKAADTCDEESHKALTTQVEQLAVDQKNIMQILLNLTQSIMNLTNQQHAYNPLMNGGMVPYHHLYNYQMPSPMIYSQQPQAQVVPLAPTEPQQQQPLPMQAQSFGPVPQQLMQATPIMYSPLFNFEQPSSMVPGTFGAIQRPSSSTFGAGII